MEFNVFRCGGIVRRGKFVELSAEPLDLRLKKTDTTKDKVRFRGIPRRSRIVEIQKVHKTKKQPSGLSPSGPRWQPSQPQSDSSTDGT
jgi:hypothetical protein